MASPRNKKPARPIASKLSEGAIGIEEMELRSNAHSDKQVGPIVFKSPTPDDVIGNVKDGKVTLKGRVVKRKKSFGQKFMETFFGDTAGSVGDYIVHDVLIPAFKSLISDAVTGGIDMALFGEKRSSRTKRDRGSSIVSYSSYYKDRDRGSDRDERRPGKKLDDLIFEKRSDAVDILDGMVELLERYDQVSISDLYDFMGVTSKDHTDQDYGWTNLRDGRVDRVRGGYLLNLPRAVALD